MLNKKGLSSILTSVLVLAFLITGFSGGAFFYKWYKSDKEITNLNNQIQAKDKELKNIVKSNIAGKDTEQKSLVEVQINSTNGAIKVTTPQIGAEITDSITIKGTANVFEGQFSARIKDENGKVLTQAGITANEDKSFEKTLTLNQVSKNQIGTLEVYDTSEKDGEINDIATIQLVLIGK